MATAYPQQKLLEMRQRAATVAERAFVTARTALTSSREALREARANLKAAMAGRVDTAARGVVTQLASQEAFVTRRRAEIEAALRAVEVAEETAKRAKREFDEASIALKAIEKLKAKWEAAEARQNARRAEAALDDLATSRHGRGPGGSR